MKSKTLQTITFKYYRVSSHHNINFTIWKLLILKLAKDYGVESVIKLLVF